MGSPYSWSQASFPNVLTELDRVYELRRLQYLEDHLLKRKYKKRRKTNKKKRKSPKKKTTRKRKSRKNKK